MHRGRRSSLAREDQGIGGDKVRGVGGDAGVVAQLGEGLLHASEVTGAVVDDEDDGAGVVGLGNQVAQVFLVEILQNEDGGGRNFLFIPASIQAEGLSGNVDYVLADGERCRCPG